MPSPVRQFSSKDISSARRLRLKFSLNEHVVDATLGNCLSSLPIPKVIVECFVTRGTQQMIGQVRYIHVPLQSTGAALSSVSYFRCLIRGIIVQR